MGTEIKIRLLKLGKKQIDLLPELQKRGLEKLHTTDLSKVINHNINSPLQNKARNLIFEILDEWEAEAQKKGE